MLWILLSLWFMKYICFGFIKALDLEAILNKLKKELRQPWNALASYISLSLVTNKSDGTKIRSKTKGDILK